MFKNNEEGLSMKRLLIVMNTPSINTSKMLEVLYQAVQLEAIDSQVTVKAIPPLLACAEDVLAADMLILGSTENLGYMSGEIKDFFDRIYYPVLEKKQGLPCMLLIRAGLDGEGAIRSIQRVLTGLKWQEVQHPLLLKGAWQDDFLESVQELGKMAIVGLDSGIF